MHSHFSRSPAGRVAVAGFALAASMAGVDPAVADLLGPAPAPRVEVGYGYPVTGAGYPAITGGYPFMVGGAYPVTAGPYAITGAPTALSPQVHPAWLQHMQVSAAGTSALARQDANARFLAGAAESRNAVVFDERAPNRVCQCGFGFDVTLVPAGLQAVIVRRPQVFFRPERLVIPSDIGGIFRVNDIKVGKEPVFVVSGSAPGRAFSENATANQMRPTTAGISQDITLIVTNTSGSDQDFEAWMQGTSVEA